MDVLLVKGNALELPTSHRVGAIVHDGAADLRLWPGPGIDRDLSFVYGPGLQAALDAQRGAVAGDGMGVVSRVHPGRLHCDFLAWVGTRPPEQGTERAPAPDPDALAAAVDAVLRFVAERSVTKVAFPALGDGPGAAPRLDRLVTIIEAARRYEDRCFADGKPPVVEEVLVCEPDPTLLGQARRRVASLAKTSTPEPVRAAEAPKPKRRRAAAGTASSRKRTSTARKKALDPEALAQARLAAGPYDRTRTYAEGDWLTHPKFGVGRVEGIDSGGFAQILFEGGDERRLVHGRGG